MLRVAGDGEEVGQDLVHAAELGLERRLALLLAQPVHAELDPAGHLDQHVEGLRVAAQLVHVEQAGHDLVERVVGRPHALALLQPVEELLGKRGQITRVGARRQSLLDLGQLRDHRVGAGLEARVAGRRVHQGARGQEVTDTVSAQLDVGCFPAAERRGRGGQPGVEAERVQEPVEVQAQQELLVPEHGVAERSVQQAHLGEREAPGRERHDLPDGRRMAVADERGQDEGERESAPSLRSSRRAHRTERISPPSTWSVAPVT